MDSPQTGLSVLGERIQEALEAETQPAEQLRAARGRFLTHVTGRGEITRRRVLGRWRFAALAAATALATIAVARQWWLAPISFTRANRTGDLGDVLAASERDPLRVDFSEGSFMVLHESASARVLETRAEGARVLLENGVADVSIAHRRGRATRWRFEAGPFQVLVTGTQFELGWQPAAEALSLTMRSGSVEISGKCLPKPRRVERGEILRLSCARAQPALPAKSAAAAEPVAPIEPEIKAEPSKFEALLDTAEKSALLAWANRERLAGRVTRARAALLALRRRYPGSKEAGTAAFTLGRMAFDQRSDYGEAARWFAAYLLEQPGGPLAGDARGRLLEAHDRLGHRSDAQRVAKEYLGRFPDGPYADQARRILAK